MARTYKLLGVILIVVAVGLMSLALTLSHDSACGAAPALPSNTELMKAIVSRCYGSPDVLKLEDIEKPSPADDEVLIKVHAAAVNPLDYHYMRGKPYVMRMMGSGLGTPESIRMGVDFAGTVEAVGKNVTRFKPGDEVFGVKRGAFAEYVAVREDRALVFKPANMTFDQTASVPVAAVTALQALREQGRLQPGQKVLINGASGGVGTFAVQIAKSFGAEVTGVCSTRNVDMVRSIGADHVIDYTQEKFTQRDERYDLIVDNVGNHSLLEFRRILNPKGIYVMVGGPKTNKWIGPLGRAFRLPVYSAFVSQEFGFFVAELNPENLTVLRDLMQGGKVTPVIDRRYTLSEVPAAIEHLEQGHARGKVVIEVDTELAHARGELAAPFIPALE